MEVSCRLWVRTLASLNVIVSSLMLSCVAWKWSSALPLLEIFIDVIIQMLLFEIVLACLFFIATLPNQATERALKLFNYYQCLNCLWVFFAILAGTIFIAMVITRGFDADLPGLLYFVIMICLVEGILRLLSIDIVKLFMDEIKRSIIRSAGGTISCPDLIASVSVNV